MSIWQKKPQQSKCADIREKRLSIRTAKELPTVWGRAILKRSGWERERTKTTAKDKIFNKMLLRKPKAKKTMHRKQTRLCLSCRQKKADSLHHIIPRKYGGEDYKDNLITLCKSCHDQIEALTEEWILSGRGYNISLLKSMVMNNGFG